MIRLTGVADLLLVRSRPGWVPAIVRIPFGLVLLAWTVTLMVDAADFLADDGTVPPDVAVSAGLRWFELSSTTAAWLALIALAAASIAITVGWRPTFWLVVAFVLLVSIQRRNTTILNSGDLLLRNLALLLVFVPTGAALSDDRWRGLGRRALGTASPIAPWGLRLVQFQLVVVYLFAFWSKSGATWRNGTAVSTALRLDDLERFPAPSWMVDDVVVVAMLTWGALAVELALAMFLWWKPARPYLIVVGIVFHLSIDTFLLVGFFGPAMVVGLLTFLDADRVDRRVAARRPASPGVAGGEERGDGSAVAEQGDVAVL